ncbi:unnamed protein product [Amoebophrya sp. A120]|nr:unnamed protein product [Amoebophrya sp. A120]|eukprot:GSA120T00012912001.1
MPEAKSDKRPVVSPPNAEAETSKMKRSRNDSTNHKCVDRICLAKVCGLAMKQPSIKGRPMKHCDRLYFTGRVGTISDVAQRKKAPAGSDSVFLTYDEEDGYLSWEENDCADGGLGEGLESSEAKNKKHRSGQGSSPLAKIARTDAGAGPRGAHQHEKTKQVSSENAHGTSKSFIAKAFQKVLSCVTMKTTQHDQQGDLHRGLISNSLSSRQVLFASRQDLDRFSFQPGDFRENICLDISDDAMRKAEEVLKHPPKQPSSSSSRGKTRKTTSALHTLAKSGMCLQVGESCVFRLTFECEPCGTVLDMLPEERKTTVEKPEVPHLVGYRGILATCVRGGQVNRGDDVTLIVRRRTGEGATSGVEDLVGGPLYEPFPNEVKGRILHLLQHKVPSGRVTTIRHILHYVGAQSSYARAVPAMLKSVLSNGWPLHRLLDSQGAIMERHIPGQKAKLAAEGVTIEKDDLHVKDFDDKLWIPTHKELFQCKAL